jgi:hypothetical protein
VEVIHGSLQDCVGAVRLTRKIPSVRGPGRLDGRCLAAAVLCLVDYSSAALSVQENWVRNSSEGSSGKFKIDQVK